MSLFIQTDLSFMIVTFFSIELNTHNIIMCLFHYRFATDSSHVHTEVISGGTVADVTLYSSVWTKGYLLLDLVFTDHQMVQLTIMLKLN